MTDYTPSIQTNGRGKIYSNLTETIGDTPLVRVPNYSKDNNVTAELLVKLEFFNPLSSVKDRLAFALIEAAEQSGKIKEGTILVEPTSGNTGIALAFICAAKGYKLVLFMPETMSTERRKMLVLLGAQLNLTPGNKGMNGAIAGAKEFVEKNENSFILQQFENKANPAIHKCTTGPEIWNDTQGKVDYLVVGVGTGGTLTGSAQYLKEKNPGIKIVAVEPEGSPVLSGGNPGPHKIQGIGAGFVPAVLDKTLIDEVVQIKDADAFATTRALATSEGIPAGISSGAVLKAATVIGTRPEAQGKVVVAVLASCSERYISTPLFADL